MTRVQAPRRAVVGMVVAWAAVVAVVGGIAFVVVSRAGSQVGQASALRTVADAPVSSGRPVSSAPATRPAPSATPSPSEPDDDTSASTTPPPEPQTRTRSFTTQGGTVVASCTGSRIGAESITVRDGWRFEDERESRKLEIHFARTGAPDVEDAEGEGEDEEGEVELKVGCVDGVPTRYSD